jgi:hypothetical protein
MRTLKKDVTNILDGIVSEDHFCGVRNKDLVARKIIKYYERYIEWIIDTDNCPTMSQNELYKKWIKYNQK